MNTAANAMSEIKSLFKTTMSPDQITSRLTALNTEIQELKLPLRMAATALDARQQELTRLATRRKYLPGDRKLSKAHKLLANEVADLELRFNSLQEQSKFARTEYDNLIVERRRQELIDESKDSPFIIPDEDPLVACIVASAICESLQYQYVSGSRYYHWLIDQAARGDNGENGAGDTEHGAGIPEIENQANDKLDDMRRRRDYLTMLRMSAERCFNEQLQRLPHDAPFIPKMLRRTDEELEAQINDRKAGQWKAKQEARQQVAQAEHAHARREDKVYQPRSTKAPEPVKPVPKGVNPRL